MKALENISRKLGAMAAILLGMIPLVILLSLLLKPVVVVVAALGICAMLAFNPYTRHILGAISSRVKEIDK